MQKELKKYEKLKEQMMALDIAIPGIIRKIYQRCGKKTCRCWKSEEYLHGPYYLWGRMIKGKLTSQSIQKEKVKLYRKWLGNKKQLKKIVAEMLKTGCAYATRIKSLKKDGE